MIPGPVSERTAGICTILSDVLAAGGNHFGGRRNFRIERTSGVVSVRGCRRHQTVPPGIPGARHTSSTSTGPPRASNRGPGSFVFAVLGPSPGGPAGKPGHGWSAAEQLGGGRTREAPVQGRGRRCRGPYGPEHMQSVAIWTFMIFAQRPARPPPTWESRACSRNEVILGRSFQTEVVVHSSPAAISVPILADGSG